MKIVRISSKGQIVIPKKVREKYNLKEGDLITFNGLTIRKLKVTISKLSKKGGK